MTLLQLATGAVDDLARLVPRAREAAAAGRAGALLDAGAGAWDPFAGEQLLGLALWCAADAPEARPVAAVAAGELARLAVAVAAAIPPGGCAACAGYAPGGGAPMATGSQAAAGSSTSSVGDVQQDNRQWAPAPSPPPQQASPRTGLAPLFGAAPPASFSGGAGSGGSFWRAS